MMLVRGFMVGIDLMVNGDGVCLLLCFWCGDVVDVVVVVFDGVVVE